MQTIFSMLSSDHALSDVLFSRSCSHVRAGDFDAAAIAMTDLAATIERHHHLEETIVFSACDAALSPRASPTAGLRAEHRQILGVLQRMATSIAEGDREAFLKHAVTLRVVLQLHNEKEEIVFYPMLETLLRTQRERIRAAIMSEGGAVSPG